MLKKLTACLALSLAISAALPGVGRAEEKELIKPGAAAAPAAELPKMSAEELKAAGERATTAGEKLGFRLGVQAWTFNKRSFFEAVDQTQALGLHFIEGFPGQRVDEDKAVVMGPKLTAEQQEAIKKHLAAANVKLVSFGVTGIPKKADEAKQFFEWAKEMGLENIVTEADPETLKAVAPLADEMGINVALHDHSRQVKSRYWSPELVLEATGSLSKRFGACADVGHWQRSGLDPTESLKKLDGRIIELHFKDLNQRGEQARTTLCGAPAPAICRPFSMK